MTERPEGIPDEAPAEPVEPTAPIEGMASPSEPEPESEPEPPIADVAPDAEPPTADVPSEAGPPMREPEAKSPMQEPDAESAPAADDDLGEGDVDGAETPDGVDEDLDEDVEEDLDETSDTDETPVGEPTPEAIAARRRRGTAPAPRAPTPSELAVRMTDRPSQVFVIASVVVFVAILLYGMLGGHKGLLTTKPSPAPTPSATIPVVTPGPSTNPSPSAGSPAGSAAPTITPAPSAAATPGSS